MRVKTTHHTPHEEAEQMAAVIWRMAVCMPASVATIEFPPTARFNRFSYCGCINLTTSTAFRFTHNSRAVVVVLEDEVTDIISVLGAMIVCHFASDIPF